MWTIVKLCIAVVLCLCVLGVGDFGFNIAAAGDGVQPILAEGGCSAEDCGSAAGRKVDEAGDRYCEERKKK